MENRVQVEAAGDRVEIRVTGKLTKEMYEEFVPVIDRQIEEHGRLRMIFVMHEFHGWTAGALWDDVKFGLKHFGDIERLAIVGETKWQHGMASFCRPFTKAKIRYFPFAELEAARAWLNEPGTKAAAR